MSFVSKPVVAVDLDEVLGQFLVSLLEYYNGENGTEYKVADFHSYRFCDVWGGTNEQATDLIYQFFETSRFKEGVLPVAEAQAVLSELSEKFDFYVVTSRQLVIVEETRKWLDRHYKGIFKDALFGNHWARENVRGNEDPTKETSGTSTTSSSSTTTRNSADDGAATAALTPPVKRSKAEMCREIGAIALVDDAPGYIADCLRNGGEQFRLGIVFGEYGWNKEDPEVVCADDPRLQRCRDWKQVREELLKLL